MINRKISLTIILALILVITSCDGEKPALTPTQAPSPTATQKAEPKEASPTTTAAADAESIPTPAEVIPTSTPPEINTENALPHYTPGVELTITKIRMSDETTGWAIGKKAGDSDHILKTADGGKEWWDVTPPEAKPVAGETLTVEAFFLDKSNAWVSYQPYEIVWRTTDAGISWQPTFVPMQANLGATLWFLDAEHGWMMKYLDAGMNHTYSALFQTSSGGQFWTKLFDPTNDGNVQSFSKTGLSFANPNVGWLTRDPYGVRSGAFVDMTSDGGSTWEQVDLPPPAGDPQTFEQEACGMFDPALFSPSSGVLVITCRRFEDDQKVLTHFLAKTADGGNSWTLTDFPGGDLIFINPNLAYAIGRDIYKSTDGGKSWTKIKEVNWDGDFSFVTENSAWAVVRNMDQTALVQTTNGCQTFSKITPQVINPPDAYQVTPSSSSSETDPSALGGGSKQIAFLSSHEHPDSLISDIYLIRVDGQDLTKITDSSGWIRHFSWSPDGQALVFDMKKGDNFDLYTIQADGTGLTQITATPHDESDPDWSPDGTQIAYVSKKEAGVFEIYLMDLDGSEKRRLVEGRTPSWSPDGAVIAFSRFEEGMFLINADGSNLTRLTDSSEYGYDHYPAWSPDGAWILFGSNRHQPGWALAESVYIMRKDGGGIGRLTYEWGGPPYAWSPNGQWIAYTENFESLAKLFMMDRQGIITRPLMEENEGYHPLWRP